MNAQMMAALADRHINKHTHRLTDTHTQLMQPIVACSDRSTDRQTRHTHTGRKINRQIDRHTVIRLDSCMGIQLTNQGNGMRPTGCVANAPKRRKKSRASDTCR